MRSPNNHAFDRGIWFCPEWNVVSEPWMTRMVDCLGSENLQEIVLIGDAPENSYNGVPMTSLQETGARSLTRWLTRPPWLRSKLRQRRRCQDFGAILARTSPDFVFANFLTATIPFRSVLARYAGRVFIHAHGYDCFPFLTKSDGSGKRKHSASYAAELAAVGNWATVVANSQFTKGLLVDAGVNPESIVIKTFGVPMPPLRKNFYDGTRPLKVLLLGRLVDFKGPCEAVRSFSEACDLGLDAQLTVVGAGPEEDDLRLAIDSSPHRSRITFTGAQPPAEVPGIMASHDVFLAHSRKGSKTGQMEAFGVAYIEALAQGMPIVGTACGGPLEIVDHGETGLISTPLDTREQARNLVRLGDPDLCRVLGTNARQVAERRYNSNQERRFFEEVVLSKSV